MGKITKYNFASTAYFLRLSYNWFWKFKESGKVQFNNSTYMLNFQKKFHQENSL